MLLFLSLKTISTANFKKMFETGKVQIKDKEKLKETDFKIAANSGQPTGRPPSVCVVRLLLELET